MSKETDLGLNIGARPYPLPAPPPWDWLEEILFDKYARLLKRSTIPTGRRQQPCTGHDSREKLTRIIRRRQPSLFHVGKELFDAIVMGTFCAGRHGMRGPDGVPCGVTVAAEQLVGNRRLIKFGGWGGEDAIRRVWGTRVSAHLPRKCQEITDRRQPRRWQSWTWPYD